jgi:hypothetical protein
MSALAAGAIGALVGALIGYLFRATDFRRDQRLKVYGEFVRAFLEVSRTGSALQSHALRLGDLRNVSEPEKRQTVDRDGLAHGATLVAFQESTAHLRLIASGRVRREAETLEVWVTNNVHGVPPFTVGATFADGATVGKQGPALKTSRTSWPAPSRWQLAVT